MVTNNLNKWSVKNNKWSVSLEEIEDKKIDFIEMMFEDRKYLQVIEKNFQLNKS